ncbi:hypothetical protein [Pantoea sp. Cy-640]|uniref:hypothetical protein n=1 Tax=Pantoea sp. Cy-640 TaxID=2608353 RepID=UPI0014191781|nr:hypothetical protein [Pantoea sp. Cy-640]NIG14194.1 hypothetical protein [Pantoea sp. Cy-640]
MKDRKITICVAYAYFTLVITWMLTVLYINYYNIQKAIEPGPIFDALGLTLILIIVFLPVVAIFLVATHKPKTNN